MKILSVDTSSNICGVAILEDNKLIKEINLDNGLTHSETLMPTIDRLFHDVNLHLSQIDLLVSDKGPGSFTGIRIGTSTIMAFADSLNIPAVGVSSLEALAYNVQTEGIICCLIDAKNSNCYYGVFELTNGAYNLLEALGANSIDFILDELKKYSEPMTFVGNGAIVNKEKIQALFPNSIFSSNNNLSAFNLGLAGFNAYKNNGFDNIMPLYLRKSQAERNVDNNGFYNK